MVGAWNLVWKDYIQGKTPAVTYTAEIRAKPSDTDSPEQGYVLWTRNQMATTECVAIQG